MNEKELEKMKFLFHTAYYIAKRNRPFSDFPDLCNLQKKNGVDLGSTYLNNMQCAFFIKSISKHISDEIIADFVSCDFFALMSDGTTDISVTETEILYVY